MEMDDEPDLKPHYRSQNSNRNEINLDNDSSVGIKSKIMWSLWFFSDIKVLALKKSPR